MPYDMLLMIVMLVLALALVGVARELRGLTAAVDRAAAVAGRPAGRSGPEAPPGGG